MDESFEHYTKAVELSGPMIKEMRLRAKGNKHDMETKAMLKQAEVC